MTEKNRKRLRQFDLDENVRALLHMPASIFTALGKEGAIGRGHALRAMFALAVRLLIVTALRIDNLASLDIGRHLVEHRRGCGRTVHIVIPPQETKTSVPFEKELAEGTVRLLDIYMSRYRPLLCPVDSPWLFPNHLGGRRCTVTFSTAISKFILREAGLKMNAHLFRSFAVKLHHAQHPEDIETPRQLLGHKTSATTLNAYAELRTDAANKRYDETLAKLLALYHVWMARRVQEACETLAMVRMRSCVRPLTRDHARWPRWDPRATSKQPGGMFLPLVLTDCAARRFDR